MVGAANRPDARSIRHASADAPSQQRTRSACLAQLLRPVGQRHVGEVEDKIEVGWSESSQPKLRIVERAAGEAVRDDLPRQEEGRERTPKTWRSGSVKRRPRTTVAGGVDDYRAAVVSDATSRW